MGLNLELYKIYLIVFLGKNLFNQLLYGFKSLTLQNLFNWLLTNKT